MLSGALWGATVYVSLSTHNVLAASGLVPLGLLTCIPGVYAFLGAYLTRRLGFSPFVLGVGWMGAELALGPLGVHGGLLAAASGHGGLADVVADLFGYVIVGFLVAFLSASLVGIVSKVAGGVGSVRFVAGRSPVGDRLRPQTFGCFPLFTISPSQPRAPPRVLPA